jgi:hypothetical protein
MIKGLQLEKESSKVILFSQLPDSVLKWLNDELKTGCKDGPVLRYRGRRNRFRDRISKILPVRYTDTTLNYMLIPNRLDTLNTTHYTIYLFL